MILQRFLKGVAGLRRNDVFEILETKGLCSTWLLNHPNDDAETRDEVLNVHAFEDHVLRFEDACTACSDGSVKDHTPYISLAVGTRAAEDTSQTVLDLPAWWMALMFATAFFQGDGWVFWGYTYVLGRPSRELAEFSEEVRDINQFVPYNTYSREGEVVAKMRIPPVRLEKAVQVSAAKVHALVGAQGTTHAIAARALARVGAGTDAETALDNFKIDEVVVAGIFRGPENFHNVRELL